MPTWIQVFTKLTFLRAIGCVRSLTEGIQHDLLKFEQNVSFFRKKD